MHPSLLPKYRGATPIQSALLNGDCVTGVTIIDLAKKMDSGDMYAQEEFSILESDTAGSLHDKLAVFGGDLLCRVIDEIREQKAVRVEQDHDMAVEVSKFSKEDGNIDWSLDAETIRRRVRAFNPWPSCFTTMPNDSAEILKILTVRVEKTDLVGVAGEVLECGGDGVLVACGKDALRLVEVQPQGKKAMDGKSFLNGRKISVGQRF